MVFVCYRAGRQDSQQQGDEESGGNTISQRATIVLSIMPGGATSGPRLPGQQYSQQQSHVSFRKTPTPGTIIRNLPTMVWNRPSKKPAAAAAAEDTQDAAVGKDNVSSKDPEAAATDSDSESNEGLCVICCCEYEAGEHIKLLPCLHMYHKLCIDAWLRRSTVCPVCQVRVCGCVCLGGGGCFCCCC